MSSRRQSSYWRSLPPSAIIENHRRTTERHANHSPSFGAVTRFRTFLASLKAKDTPALRSSSLVPHGDPTLALQPQPGRSPKRYRLDGRARSRASRGRPHRSRRSGLSLSAFRLTDARSPWMPISGPSSSRLGSARGEDGAGPPVGSSSASTSPSRPAGVVAAATRSSRTTPFSASSISSRRATAGRWWSGG